MGPEVCETLLEQASFCSEKRALKRKGLFMLVLPGVMGKRNDDYEPKAR